MALRVYTDCQLTVSIDNATNPQNIVFDSGDLENIDTTDFAEGASFNISVPPNTADMQVALNGMSQANVSLILAQTPIQPLFPTPPITVQPLQVKLVPVGGSASATPWMTMQFGIPALIPFALAEIHLANTDTATAILVQIGAAGN